MQGRPGGGPCAGTEAPVTSGWKVFKRRKDGSVGPLFIDTRLRVPVGRWLRAEPHRTPGYAFRPGWHATIKPYAPHLRTSGPDRVWCRVSLRGVRRYERPESQGGTWLLAAWLRLDEVDANPNVSMPENGRFERGLKRV